MKDRIITKGKIWTGKTWAYAIKSIHNNPDGRIVSKMKSKNPHLLLCDEMVFDAYYLEADAGTKSLRTKIPKELNDFVAAVTSFTREIK